jgi:hypothetical protein
MNTTIFRIKIRQIKIQTDMEGHLHLDNLQELAFRLAAGSQKEAEHIARGVWTTWMRSNPGVPSTMTLEFPLPIELGETAFDPEQPWV